VLYVCNSAEKARKLRRLLSPISFLEYCDSKQAISDSAFKVASRTEVL
jgi:hypothetical protein